MAVIRNDGFRSQMLVWGVTVKPRNSVELSDDEWGVLRERPAIREQLRAGTLVEEGESQPSRLAPLDESEPAVSGVEMGEGEVAVDLDSMDRNALKAFAEAQSITDDVDMRLATDKLRSAIKKAMA